MDRLLSNRLCKCVENMYNSSMKTNRSQTPVLLLCDYRAPYGGNFIASLRCLDDALRLRGMRAVWAFPAESASRDWCARLIAEGRDVSFLPDHGTLSQCRALMRLIRQYDASILHAHFGLFKPAKLAALLDRRLKLILHIHSDFSAGRAPTARQRLFRKLNRTAERLIGSGRITRITVSETAAFDGEAIPVHNALVAERFATKALDGAATRKLFDIPPDAKLALVFGWSPFVKGVDVAVNAVGNLIANGHGDRMLGVVLGRAYTKEKMQSFIAEHTPYSGSEPWLRLLPPDEDVFRYHKAADVFVSASRSETFSYALLEAMSVGRACVISDIMGTAWAQAYPTVFTFATENAAALADALVHAERQAQTDAGKRALETVSRQVAASFGIADWVNAILTIYGL